MIITVQELIDELEEFEPTAVVQGLFAGTAFRINSVDQDATTDNVVLVIEAVQGHFLEPKEDDEEIEDD